MLPKYLALPLWVLLVGFGAFLVVYGGMDDSPGAQGLGLLIAVGGVVTIVRRAKR